MNSSAFPVRPEDCARPIPNALSRAATTPNLRRACNSPFARPAAKPDYAFPFDGVAAVSTMLRF
jgi:hypothetical protein